MTDREVMQQALEALSAELWTMLDKPVDEQYRVKYAYLLTVITALRTALEQPKHEPMAVAYLCENGVGHRYFRWKKPSDIYKPIGLYTAPPQRLWVELTEEERNACLVSADPCEALADPEAKQLIEDVEAALRSKNK